MCRIIDACRVCSFKEMQQIAECQKTGFRLIMKCIEKYQTQISNEDERIENRECEEF